MLSLLGIVPDLSEEKPLNASNLRGLNIILVLLMKFLVQRFPKQFAKPELANEEIGSLQISTRYRMPWLSCGFMASSRSKHARAEASSPVLRCAWPSAAMARM